MLDRIFEAIGWKRYRRGKLVWDTHEIVMDILLFLGTVAIAYIISVTS